jgi:hypothetical protein
MFKPNSPLLARRYVWWTLALTPFFSAVSSAQPDINNAPKAENPANRPPRRELTPEQRLRLLIRSVGITDTARQQALITYIEGEAKERTTLMAKGRQLQIGLRGALTDTQVAGLLNEYQGAVEEDQERRLKAQAQLKKTVDVAKLPKVESLLTLMGIYGTGPTVIGSWVEAPRGNRPANNRRGNNRPENNRPQANGPAGNGNVAPPVAAPDPAANILF